MSELQDANFINDIGKLYLNDNYSDVTFRIDDTEIPGHRMILAQRSPVFSKLFLKEDSESRKQAVTLIDTPLGAFKQFLKFIYTGVITFDSLEKEVVFGTLQLAVTYEIKRLEEITVQHLQSICNRDNLTEILNVSLKCSKKNLTDYCLELVKASQFNIITSENFEKLSPEALSSMLNFMASSKVPEVKIFDAFVGWMKSNITKRKHYLELLKQIDLRNLPMAKVITILRPLKLIDEKDLLDIVYEQTKRNYPDGNVLAARTGARIISGGASSFFTDPTEGKTLKHNIGDNNEIIKIELECFYMLNYLEMELADGDKSYWIEISEDNKKWTRIIDYSNYVCRSVQRLYFKECPVRYIRIHGTAPTDGTFEILRLEAYYVKEPKQFDPETGIVIPLDNVALESKNAIVLNAINNTGVPNSMLTPFEPGKYTYHQIGKPPLIVQLPQPYMLNRMFVYIWNGSYNFTIEVSTDKINWTHICTSENKTYKHDIRFAKQPVTFIKLTGISTKDDKTLAKYFDCAELKCFASK